jgi:hypothetical protein
MIRLVGTVIISMVNLLALWLGELGRKMHFSGVAAMKLQNKICR